MTLRKVGKFWKADFTGPDGKRTLVSTKCTDKDKAKAAVKESGLEQLVAAGKVGRLTNTVISQITTGKKLTLAKAADAYEESLLRRRAPKTAANIMAVVRAWLKATNLDSAAPAIVTEDHVDRWINDPESAAKYHTRRIGLSDIRTFFDFCIDHGWVTSNPAGKQRVSVRMELLSHAQKEPTEKQCFASPEIVRLLTELDKEPKYLFWSFAVRISNEIGLRLGDVCQLEWDCFSAPGRVTVWTDKRDRRVSVPISKELEELVSVIPVESTQFLFPNERERIRDTSRRAGLSMDFKRLCERNGITGKSFHCLRHTCISRWAKEGKTLDSIAKDVGHANTKTTQSYVH